jgi:tetrahydromethanopterin S-methyltransferase subunit E
MNFEHAVNENVYQEWNNVNFKIPSVCPSSNGTSKVLEIAYCLILEIGPPGPSTYLRVKIPITIGTIPINKEDVQVSFGEQSFEKSFFGSSQQGKQGDIGVVIQMDKDYVPSYPYFKDYKMLDKT